MIPVQSDSLEFDFEVEQQPTYTYNLRFDTEGMGGFHGGLEAMRQAVCKIILTERYQYVIYSWNYGVELADLFGQPIPFVYSELKRRITEALLWDDRITNVDNFVFTHNRGRVLATFDVTTTEGSFQAELPEERAVLAGV